jgi:Tol biopolymer transport system component
MEPHVGPGGMWDRMRAVADRVARRIVGGVRSRAALQVVVALSVAGLAACGSNIDARRHPVGCSRLVPPPEQVTGGGRLAVASDPDGEFAFEDNESDVFIVNADGSRRRRLTVGRGNDFSPAWSPDGRRLVFRSDRDRTGPHDLNNELYAICADGTGERRLTTTPGIQERSPAFSPDGTWLAFAGEDRHRVLDLYVMRPDGTQRRNLTKDLDCGAEYPSWAPDGRRVAFHCFQDFDNLEVYVIDVDGSPATRVTRSDGEDSFPSWSPDGDLILYSRGNADLYVIRPDGTGRRRLTRHPAAETFPSWSPDGRGIAFASDRDRNALDYQVYVMDAAGSRARKVTKGRASHFNPAWQPR